MQRISIDVAVNRDRLNAHFFAGPDDATSDLATIGDQDLLELARIKSHQKTLAAKKHKTHKIVFVPFVPFCGLTLDSE